MSPTEDTITAQFVPGFGIVELPNGEKFAEPIRVMTPHEVKEREELRHANISENLRARALLSQRFINADDLDDRCTTRSSMWGRCTLKAGHSTHHLAPNDIQFK